MRHGHGRRFEGAGQGFACDMRQAARGIGLLSKLKAYDLQGREGARHGRGEPAARLRPGNLSHYGIGTQILFDRASGASACHNNPKKGLYMTATACALRRCVRLKIPAQTRENKEIPVQTKEGGKLGPPARRGSKEPGTHSVSGRLRVSVAAFTRKCGEKTASRKATEGISQLAGIMAVFAPPACPSGKRGLGQLGTAGDRREGRGHDNPSSRPPMPVSKVIWTFNISSEQASERNGIFRSQRVTQEVMQGTQPRNRWRHAGADHGERVNGRFRGLFAWKKV